MICDSCGGDEPEVHPVHRKYVTAKAWDQEADERVMPDVEHWCYACCTHYPHDPAPR